MYLNADEYICLHIDTSKTLYATHNAHAEQWTKRTTTTAKYQHYTNIIRRICDRKKLCKFVINSYSDIQTKKNPCRPFTPYGATGARAIARYRSLLWFVSLLFFSIFPLVIVHNYRMLFIFFCQISAISSQRFIHKCKAHKLSYQRH